MPRRAAVLAAMCTVMEIPLAASFAVPAGRLASALSAARLRLRAGRSDAPGLDRPRGPRRAPRGARRVVVRRAVEVDTVGAAMEVSRAISPRQARQELEQLAENCRWEKAAVVGVLERIQGQGDAKPLFNSSAILFRRTTANEIQMLTRGTIKPGTIDLNGDDDMEVLNQAFYATLFTSMFLSTVAAVLIPDVPDLPFLRDSVLRFVITFGIGAVPFAFLGAGLSVPGLLQAALIQIRRLISDEFRQRLIVHEAGHLLVGYCMGLPVADYKANDAILNACSFFALDEDVAGRLDHRQVDVLCGVSLAGVVAESIKFGDGLGGFADLSQLQGFISRASPRLDDKQQKERVRWGCVSAYTTLKRNEVALDRSLSLCLSLSLSLSLSPSLSLLSSLSARALSLFISL